MSGGAPEGQRRRSIVTTVFGNEGSLPALFVELRRLEKDLAAREVDDAFLSLSIVPIRAMSIFGALISVASLGYGAVIGINDEVSRSAEVVIEEVS